MFSATFPYNIHICKQAYFMTEIQLAEGEGEEAKSASTVVILILPVGIHSVNLCLKIDTFYVHKVENSACFFK